MVISSNKMQLKLLGLPPIDTLEDFSSHTHLSKGLIYRLSKFSDKNYVTYTLPKKTGGGRIIAQPSAVLKALQSWILRHILDRLAVSPACKGFERKTSILDNAKPHIGALALMCLDLDDFFPSIKVNQVWAVFRVLGYNERIAAVLASLCTYNGSLPQGSPASPKLSNLVSLRLDARLLGYVGIRGIIYTRYADDLSFSSLSYPQLAKAYSFIRRIIESEGFSLNKNKTRFAGAARQHKITGLIVNDKQAGIGRVWLRKIRSEIKHICKHPKNDVPDDSVERIIGLLSFVKSVDEIRYSMLAKYIMKLKSKFPDSGVSLLLNS